MIFLSLLLILPSTDIQDENAESKSSQPETVLILNQILLGAAALFENLSSPLAYDLQPSAVTTTGNQGDEQKTLK